MSKVLAGKSVGKLVLAVSLLLSLVACGYNEVITRDEEVKAAWAEVQNQYKRRSDLVPSLVSVVKGAANFEQQTLQNVVEARAKVAGLHVDNQVLEDPAKLRAFENVQAQLQGSLSRLLMVAENYPTLKATENFRDLQAQLEGTENRIVVARRRFIEAVALYNQVVLNFPSMIGAKLRGKHVRPTFEGTSAEAVPPEVKF